MMNKYSKESNLNKYRNIVQDYEKKPEDKA